VLAPANDDSDMLLLWDCHFDTFEIAARLSITEAEAERRLWRAREQRRIVSEGK
jgi:hypothetical protein